MSRTLRRNLLRLHHRAGVVVVVFVLFLVVTGILINHANTLGWDKQRLANAFWLKLYGVEVSAVDTGYPVSGHWLAFAGSRLYFDARPLADCQAPLSGAVMVPVSAGLGQAGVALCSDATILFTLAGELIEKMPMVGAPVSGLALKDDVIYARQNPGIVQFDPVSGGWSPAAIDTSSLSWSQSASLPAPMATQLRYANTPEDLTWERLLLDLHSGRLFGFIGVLLVDLAGVLMLMLALTGLWSVMTRKR